MLMKMTKEQFIESMQNAKEEEKEYVNMADVAKIGDEVKEAVKKGTSKEITQLAEPTAKRSRKEGKSRIKAPAAWQESFRKGIEQMLSESAEKIAQAKALLSEAEELVSRAETLGGMI